MRPNKILVKIPLVLLIIVGVMACELRDRSYQGPAKVAWKRPHENSPLIVRPVTQPDTTITLTAQLIAHQRDHDLTFNVSVVDTLNTAAEIGGKGSAYMLPSKTVTIPADSSEGKFTVKILNSNVKKGKQVPVSIKLHSNNGIIADPNIGNNHILIVSSN